MQVTPGAEMRSQSGQHGLPMGQVSGSLEKGLYCRGDTPALGQRTRSNSGSAVKLLAVLG